MKETPEIERRRYKNALLQHPYCGQIKECTNRGFGFLTGPTGEEMIHVRDHAGRTLNTMEGLEGQYCSFVIGGHPFRYLQGRHGWNNTIVQWLLLDEIESAPEPASYSKEWSSKVLLLDKRKLFSFLAAKWYVALWKRTGNAPRAPIKAGDQLLTVLNTLLASSDGLEELLRLLSAICKSPWYGCTELDRDKVCKLFFRPEEWPLRVFLANDGITEHIQTSDSWLTCGSTLETFVRKARTIAIDLESDRKSIFQIGWKNATEVSLRTNRKGLSRQELYTAVHECLNNQKAPCIVGHNILSWDLPILQDHGVELPEKAEIWDTLIASWIINPWRSSHALIVHKNAHRADADADACYALFEQQEEKLSHCLEGVNCDIRVLVERLYEEPSRLSEVIERNYPANLIDTSETRSIYPSSRLYEINWQKECHVELIGAENRYADPVLSPEVCHQLAKERSDLAAKAVSIVVSDAATNGVEVRLSLLPPWLADDNLLASLREKHADVLPNERVNTRTFYIAEDILRLAQSQIDQQLGIPGLTLVYPDEIALAWQKIHRRYLDENGVRDAFPGVTEGIINRTLIPVQKDDGQTEWLIFEPPGFKATNASWSLLPRIPDWLQPEPIEQQKGQSISCARIPRWRDGNTKMLDVDRIFVSPDTANRKLYLSDITHCVLNLLKESDKQAFLLVGMKWREEADCLQSHLIHLGMSTQHPGSCLRRLEHTHHAGHHVLACSMADISEYLLAADRLGIVVWVAVSEVPLHEWHAAIHAPCPIANVSDHQYAEDADNDNPEYVEEDQLDKDRQEISQQQIQLRKKDILDTSRRFLETWIYGLIASRNDHTSVIILDARLMDLQTARSDRIQHQDIPFYNIEELLDEAKTQIFYEVCFPRRDEGLVPKDYDEYKQFLQKNWGYEDFRSGTQRPAIEKIIKTNRDILLRLPTGEGKSIIFHLPALLRSHYSGKLTVVITPLRALMRDQAKGLWDRHFNQSVDYLSGGRDGWINKDVYDGVLDGRIRLLFVAPERFRVNQFTEVLERRRRMDNGLEFLVFDEAHCISEWGFEFRPDYLFAAQYVSEWFKQKNLPGNPHRLLLTSATVTQRNRTDLEQELNLGGLAQYEVLPVDMPHPIQPFIELESFVVHENEEDPSDEKFEKIIAKLATLNLDVSAALVFVQRRKDCHRLSDALNTYAAQDGSFLEKLHALPFHAGLPETLKTEACDLLKERKVNVLVCTKAFGMGMDISHLHACIHHRPPLFIEEYLQEVGRIGRDESERLQTGNERVTATLLYNQNDMERNLTMLHNNTVKPPDLQDMLAFCLNKAVSIEGAAKALCIVPAEVRVSATKKLDHNQVSSCLFWLAVPISVVVRS